MKRCLKCGHTYSDDTLNFCLNDGEILVQHTGYEPPPTRYADDSPPTLLMNEPRVTNPIDWPQSSIGRPQASPPAIANQQYGLASAYGTALDTTLATVSLVLGVLSVPLICCFGGGMVLGLPAAIVGYIAMRNVDSNPMKYGGRGMAIGGMVIGIITFIASIIFLIASQLS